MKRIRNPYVSIGWICFVSTVLITGISSSSIAQQSYPDSTSRFAISYQFGTSGFVNPVQLGQVATIQYSLNRISLITSLSSMGYSGARASNGFHEDDHVYFATRSARVGVGGFLPLGTLGFYGFNVLAGISALHSVDTGVTHVSSYNASDKPWFSSEVDLAFTTPLTSRLWLLADVANEFMFIPHSHIGSLIQEVDRAYTHARAGLAWHF